jgi:hypothetical protein
MDINRNFPACGLYTRPSDGKLYAVVAGGENGTTYLTTTIVYDVAANTWASGPDYPTTVQRYGGKLAYFQKGKG